MPQFPLNSCQTLSGVPKAISCVGAWVLLSSGSWPFSSALTHWNESLIKANCNWRHSCYRLLPRGPVSVLSFPGMDAEDAVIFAKETIFYYCLLQSYYILGSWYTTKIWLNLRRSSELSLPPAVTHWVTTRLWSLIVTANRKLLVLCANRLEDAWQIGFQDMTKS